MEFYHWLGRAADQGIVPQDTPFMRKMSAMHADASRRTPGLADPWYRVWGPLLAELTDRGRVES